MRAFVTGDPDFDDQNLVAEALKRCWLEDFDHRVTIIHRASGRPLDVIAQYIGNDKWDSGFTVDAVAAQTWRDGSAARRIQFDTILERGVDVILLFRFVHTLGENPRIRHFRGLPPVRYYEKLDARSRMI